MGGVLVVELCEAVAGNAVVVDVVVAVVTVDVGVVKFGGV